MYGIVYCFIKHGQNIVERIRTPLRKNRSNSRLTFSRLTEKDSIFDFEDCSSTRIESPVRSSPVLTPREPGSRLAGIIN